MARPTAAELFEQHHLALFRYAYRQTRRRDVAEDVVQDAFLRVVRGLEDYEASGRDRAWLFTIVRRLLCDRQRALSHRGADAILGPERGLEATQESSVAIAQALADVPAVDREAFLLREVGGFSYSEIAEICDLSLDAVRSRIYRARLRLRAALSPGRSHHERCMG